jgi:hypothetical protein
MIVANKIDKLNWKERNALETACPQQVFVVSCYCCCWRFYDCYYYYMIVDLSIDLFISIINSNVPMQKYNIWQSSRSKKDFTLKAFYDFFNEVR